MVPKFRGRNIETGEWVYGHLFYFDDGRHFISPTGTDVVGGYGGAPAKYRLENLVCFEIKPETVGQSTGLLNCETEDGKNVEGWEGDVADVGWSEQAGDFNSHRIILKSPFDYSTDEARWLIHAEYIIIRGNIYENPELLEQADES